MVGESGAGKSITGMAVIGLLEPPGRIAAGEVRLEGRRIDNLPHEELRRIRGRTIGVIFQDPLTSLNPLYTIGQQLEETILTHLVSLHGQARERALSLLREVGIPAPESALQQLSAPFFRRHAPARGDRARPRRRAAPADRRRAHHRARRLDPGADHRAPQAPRRASAAPR